MIASGSDRGVRRTDSAAVSAFLPRVVVDVQRLACVNMVYKRIGCHRCCEPRVMNSAIRPFGVARILKFGGAGNDGLQRRNVIRNRCWQRPAIASVRRPRFDFRNQQSTGRSVEAIAKSDKCVRIKHPVSANRLLWIKYEPRTEIESVCGWVELRSSGAGVANLV